MIYQVRVEESGGLTHYPFAERVKGGYRSGVYFWRDDEVSDVLPVNEQAGAATLPCPDGVKMTRETLCAAAAAIIHEGHWARRDEHVRRLQALIDACDEHRPLGSNGKHGDLHTATCGCDDK